LRIDKNIEKTELVKIVRSLITNKDLKDKYIKKYLITLSKAMNGQNGFVNVDYLSKIVEKDATYILEKEARKE